MRDDHTVGCAHTCIHYAIQSRKRVFIERRSTIRRRELFRRLRVTRLLEIDNGANRFLLSADVVIPFSPSDSIPQLVTLFILVDPRWIIAKMGACEVKTEI